MPRRKKSVLRKPLKWALAGLFGFFLFTALQVAAFRFVNPPFNSIMLWDYFKHSGVVLKRWRLAGWVPLDEISPHLRRAVLAGEDQRFLMHRGFDWTELSIALKDMAADRGIRGASTISMQAARTVFLWPERSWLRKLLEAYYTVVMEAFWSKERILEVYLNMVDWGRGYAGAESAARGYFNQSAAGLTPSQAAAMAAVLPNPHRWSPVKPDHDVVRRIERIRKDMALMPLVNGR